MSQPHIAIIGAGAIGQLFYHQLANIESEHCAKISLVARNAIASQMLSITKMDGSLTSLEAPILDQQSLVNIDLLIVCVKAYQVEPLLTPLLNQLNPHCHIILLHNGMGPHLAIAEMLKQYPNMGLSLATTSFGALKLEKWHVKHTGMGQTQLGHYTGVMLKPQLIDVLLKALPNSHWQPKIINALWQKLVVNCAINPLTAYFNCLNGELSNMQYQDDITSIINECITVAKLDGVELDEVGCTSLVYKVIEQTSKNSSSMRQDVLNQRQTEIDYISGYVVKRATAHNLNADINQLYLSRVNGLSD